MFCCYSFKFIETIFTLTIFQKEREKKFATIEMSFDSCFRAPHLYLLLFVHNVCSRRWQQRWKKKPNNKFTKFKQIKKGENTNQKNLIRLRQLFFSSQNLHRRNGGLFLLFNISRLDFLFHFVHQENNRDEEKK